MTHFANFCKHQVLTDLALLEILSSRRSSTEGSLAMPSEVIEKIQEVEEKVLEAVDSAREPIVRIVERAAERIGDRVPEVDIELPDAVPTLEEVVSLQFDFVRKLLEAQERFLLSLLEATKPVREKLIRHEKESKAPSAGGRSRSAKTKSKVAEAA